MADTGTAAYGYSAADIHSHALPGCDDGARTMKEALELLRLDREEGAGVVFATPHFGVLNSGYEPDRNDVLSRFRELSDAAAEAVPGIRLALGTEWYCSDDIVRRIRKQEAFPMGGSEWYMVEFIEWGGDSEPADVILRRLGDLRENGVQTILAHPERYRAIQQDWDLAKRIRDLGVLLQVNAYDLYLNPKDDTRNLAQWMAKERMIAFIGSDMHGTREGKRRPRMKEGIRWLYENTDEAYADGVVRGNAEKLLNVKRLP